MKLKIILISIFAITCFIMASTISCVNNIQDGNSPKNNNNTANVTEKYNPTLDRKYLKEGFVSSDIFRVVIVYDGKAETASRDDIEDTAKKRSHATLKKFLRNNNRVVTHSVNAKLLNLINDNGILLKKDELSRKNSVFYFDIKKSSIKRYIDSISPRR